jgi:hypothetical protein
MDRHGDSWTAYWLWCLAGAGLCLGVLSILTIGPFVLLVTLGLCGWLLWRLDFGWGMLGLLSGAAVPVLYVAWLNRDGPGTVCTSTATETSCGDEWSPWPFVALAVVLAGAGIVTFVRLRRT